jgi:chromosome segregation ATPase
MTNTVTPKKTAAAWQAEIDQFEAERAERLTKQQELSRTSVAPESLAGYRREVAENDHRLDDLRHLIAHAKDEHAKARESERDANVKAWVARSAEITKDAAPLAKRADALARDLAGILAQIAKLADEDDRLATALRNAGSDGANNQGGARAGYTPNGCLQDLTTLYGADGVQLWPTVR